MFGLPGEMAFQDAGTLSGGEKTKLALAQLVAGRTTCCCSTSRRTTSTRPRGRPIAEALQDWPGAMVIVSHDAEFVEALEPERVLMMPDGDARLLERDLPRPRRAGLSATGGAPVRRAISFRPAFDARRPTR